MPMIWLRAKLREAEDLSRRFWLTGQSEIDARLVSAARMLTVLDRVRQVQHRIRSISDEMVRYRATRNLDEIVVQIGGTSLTEQDVTQLTAQLDRFNDWCDSSSDKQKVVYQEAVLARIQRCLSEMQSFPFFDPAVQQLVETLREKLQKVLNNKQTDFGVIREADATYRRLAILWDARKHPEWLTRIAALHQGDQKSWRPIEEVYQVIDEGWWEILTNEQATKCEVEGPPASTLDPPEAYDTVIIRLKTETTKPEDEGLSASYLMRKKLIYVWTVTIADAKGAAAKTLTVMTTEPQVAQYSPAKGQLSASVEINYRGRRGRGVGPSRSVKIGPSSDIGVRRALERADTIAFAVALGVSVLSGIKLQALGTTFGSLTDYLALFAWGAAVDQGKNFLQSLAIYSPISTGTTTLAANVQAPTAPDAGAPHR